MADTAGSLSSRAECKAEDLMDKDLLDERFRTGEIPSMKPYERFGSVEAFDKVKTGQ